MHESYIEAARREKRFKNWCREWKITLLNHLILHGVNLYEEFVHIRYFSGSRGQAADVGFVDVRIFKCERYSFRSLWFSKIKKLPFEIVKKT